MSDKDIDWDFWEGQIEPVIEVGNNVPFDDNRSQDAYGETFHSLLTKHFDDCELTPRQRHWCEAYFTLSIDGFIPTATDVAQILRVSVTASANMQERILTRLSIAFNKHSEEQAKDYDFEKVYMEKEKSLLAKPCYVEKRRGKKGYTIWRAAVCHIERVGRAFYSGRMGEEILKKDIPSEAPLRVVTVLKPSFLSLWWLEKARKEAQKAGCSYTEAYKKLYAVYWDRWDLLGQSPQDRLCRFCKCLLPLHERINGKLITARSGYCPAGNCKTNFKRYRKL
ncbi:MAG: hypothetical protein A4E63_01025 [Syntrophorhabdus sp. PtaU1.Bin050]|nr:MAG: hypothetical protein A4E63_01025 [Syntrophorhabdus sp. PtaU1.Bin050]